MSGKRFGIYVCAKAYISYLGMRLWHLCLEFYDRMRTDAEAIRANTAYRQSFWLDEMACRALACGRIASEIDIYRVYLLCLLGNRMSNNVMCMFYGGVTCMSPNSANCLPLQPKFHKFQLLLGSYRRCPNADPIALLGCALEHFPHLHISHGVGAHRLAPPT